MKNPLQRLTILPARVTRPALAMVKETGTPVDFAYSREIGLQVYTFRDDVVGVYAYQRAPIMVPAAVRHAFVNGNMEDLQNGLTGQGMPIQYMRISWNEEPVGDDVRITDMVVGLVIKVSRDFNTGPAYAIDALKKVEWFNNLISKMYMPWQSWLLLTATQNEAYHSWYWEAVSGPWIKSARRWQPIPDPPSIDEVKIAVTNEIDAALGEFVRNLLDKGFTPTILGYRVQVCYERSGELFSPMAGGYHYYRYRTHIRFSWDFVTDPEYTVEDALFVITSAFIFNLILVVGTLIIAGITVYRFLDNVTTERSGYVEYAVLRDPEGNPIYDDEGNPIIVPTKEGWREGPPEWWADVIPTVVLGALIIVGAIIVVPPIIRSFRG